jgi:hypothetical protein
MIEQLRLGDDVGVGDGVVEPIASLDNCATCEHCGEEFTPRARSGGKPQRFCCTQCRQRRHSANPNVAQRSGSPVGASDVASSKEPDEESRTSGLPIGSTVPSSPHIVRPNGDSDRFDWVNDDSIVLAEQPATAIYRNRKNSIVIRQQASWDDEMDSFVIITNQNVMSFVDQLCELVGIAEFGGPKPRTAPKRGAD